MKNGRSAYLIFAAVLALAPLAGAEDKADKTYDELKVLIDVLDYVQQNYVDEPETRKLIYGAASGMVRTLDPFSQFMEPEIHKELKTETEGEFGGLGIRIGIKDDWLTVVTPLPGTPAYRLGVLPNDRIIEIDGETTKDISMVDALTRLRGAPGTKVKLVMMRSSDESDDGPWTTHEYEIARENIKIESVQSRSLEGGVGYVRVIEFSARTPGDVSGAVEGLRKQGMTSLVLDLRNNPGGLLSSAVEVASSFIGDTKLIVYTQGRKIEKPQEFRSNAQAPYPFMPLVLLINEGSASGSEIVAGALQDHRRAVVMGTRSFGKASVQSVIPLSDGSGLRLTVARYYTPLGRSIHRDEKNKTGGILPDIVVPVTRETEGKLYAQWEMVYAKDRKPHSAVKQEEMIRDEALDRAVEMLKARDVLGSLKGREG